MESIDHETKGFVPSSEQAQNFFSLLHQAFSDKQSSYDAQGLALKEPVYRLIEPDIVVACARERLTTKSNRFDSCTLITMKNDGSSRTAMNLTMHTKTDGQPTINFDVTDEHDNKVAPTEKLFSHFQEAALDTIRQGFSQATIDQLRADLQSGLASLKRNPPGR